MADYNQHVRLPSLGPWLVGTTKVYSSAGSRHCYGIITQIPGTGFERLTPSTSSSQTALT